MRNTEKLTLTRSDAFALIILIIGTLAYFLLSPKVVLNPITETQRMNKLEQTKQITDLAPFETDGCSGNISKIWNTTIEGFSRVSPSFEEEYINAKVPFEDACIVHDKLYHSGRGGYAGRLNADNKLRSDIILYGIKNADMIVNDSVIQTKEEVMFIYEIIAEAIYRSVRIGGSPCTGEPYAWGFGYNNGVCE